MIPFLIIFSVYCLMAWFVLRWMELATQNRPKYGHTLKQGPSLDDATDAYQVSHTSRVSESARPPAE